MLRRQRRGLFRREPLERLEQFRRFNRERGGEILRRVELIPLTFRGERALRVAQGVEIATFTAHGHTPPHVSSRAIHFSTTGGTQASNRASNAPIVGSTINMPRCSGRTKPLAVA